MTYSESTADGLKRNFLIALIQLTAGLLMSRDKQSDR